MNVRLSPAERQQFERDGFLFPLTVFEPAEVARYREILEEIERRLAAAGCRPPYKQLHLSFRWAYDLVTHPGLLDLIEDLIGPDFLVFNSTVFAKPPRSPAYVPWHQDSSHLVQDHPRMVAAWIALTTSTSQSGCMRMIPGSHKLGRLAHASRIQPDNLLDSLQRPVEREVNEAEAVDVMVQSGQLSLHHANTIHSSNPNHSDGWRIGYVVRYITPDVQTRTPLYGAVLARGRDAHGHYKLLKASPPADIERGIANHVAYRAWSDAMFSGIRQGSMAPVEDHA
jgi:non-heme Fe2+,alpha-ketoglutarate-dependent halogenase